MHEENPPSDTPFTLTGILQPEAALAAAQRLQRRYQGNSPGAHSLFGRDGRRVEGRLQADAMAETAEA